MKNIQLTILALATISTNCSENTGSNSKVDSSQRENRSIHEVSEKLEDSIKNKIRRALTRDEFSTSAVARLIVKEDLLTIDEAKYYLTSTLNFKKPNHKIFMEFDYGVSTYSSDLDACFLYISRQDPLWCLDLLFNKYLKFGFVDEGEDSIPNCKILFDNKIPKIGFLGAIVIGWSEGDNQGYQNWLKKIKLANSTNSFKHEFSREYFYEEPSS